MQNTESMEFFLQILPDTLSCTVGFSISSDKEKQQVIRNDFLKRKLLNNKLCLRIAIEVLLVPSPSRICISYRARSKNFIQLRIPVFQRTFCTKLSRWFMLSWAVLVPSYKEGVFRLQECLSWKVQGMLSMLCLQVCWVCC